MPPRRNTGYQKVMSMVPKGKKERLGWIKIAYLAVGVFIGVMLLGSYGRAAAAIGALLGLVGMQVLIHIARNM